VPELPDLTIYLESLERRIAGETLDRVLVISPFVVRSVDPPIASLAGHQVTGFGRIGKRLVIEFDGDFFLVIHLMVAGRLQWSEKRPKPNRRVMLAIFDFPSGSLVLTEAGTKKRASIHLAKGRGALAQFARGGIEPLEISARAFAERLRSENHTLKRSLTDPRLFSGIGNAYSDEILHRAKLSPLRMSTKLSDAEIARLYEATRASLTEWTAKLREELGDKWPAKVTAFRDDFAAHGKFGKPCPVCGTPVQRIRYADNETNYCARCQTEGRRLADRGMSRLLKEDWPRDIDDDVYGRDKA
jgi:formamidopyrimidine-DNA glycosylase